MTQTSWDRFGIMNHLGGVWTPQTFDSEREAQAYLDQQRRIWPDGGEGLRRHKVVPVKAIVRVKAAKQAKAK